MNITDDLKNAYEDGYEKGFNDGFEVGQRDVHPERKKGKWMAFCRGKVCNCSVCYKGYDHTYEFIEEWNFCPNCGAKMER